MCRGLLSWHWGASASLTREAPDGRTVVPSLRRWGLLRACAADGRRCHAASDWTRPWAGLRHGLSSPSGRGRPTGLSTHAPAGRGRGERSGHRFNTGEWAVRLGSRRSSGEGMTGRRLWGQRMIGRRLFRYQNKRTETVNVSLLGQARYFSLHRC